MPITVGSNIYQKLGDIAESIELGSILYSQISYNYGYIGQAASKNNFNRF